MHTFTYVQSFSFSHLVDQLKTAKRGSCLTKLFFSLSFSLFLFFFKFSTSRSRERSQETRRCPCNLSHNRTDVYIPFSASPTQAVY